MHPRGTAGAQSGVIVCGVSRSREARRVARAAADLAAGLGDRLVLVNVVTESSAGRLAGFGTGRTATERREAQSLLRDLSQGDPLLEHSEVRVESGRSTAAALVAVAESSSAEAIVIGGSSSASRRSSSGAVTDALIAQAPCPVVIVPESSERRLFLPRFEPGGAQRPRTPASSSRF